MEENKSNTEEQILKAAEKVFLSKGFKNSKISDIAELAGVNNALINYYFRTKEKLFDKVLHSKIKLLAQAISNVVDKELPFMQVIKNLVEAQFDFFNENELLPRFILSEVLPDESRIGMFRDNVIPIILKASVQLDKKLQQEIAAGNIRNVKIFDLLYSMTSMNVLCFVVKPIIMGIGAANPMTPHYSQIMDDRKNNNVEIIMNYLTVKK